MVYFTLCYINKMLMNTEYVYILYHAIVFKIQKQILILEHDVLLNTAASNVWTAVYCETAA